MLRFRAKLLTIVCHVGVLTHAGRWVCADVRINEGWGK